MPDMEKAASSARPVPETSTQSNPDNNHHRALSQQEAWRLAVIVFGSELPSPRRDICGTTSDGIRYWRAASR
jgi:hypothetical protein